MIYTIKNEAYEAKISSLGAELISLVFKNRECIWEGKEEFWGDHAPVLFPICGQIKDKQYTYGGKTYGMRGHGFAKRCEFSLVSLENSKITLCLRENEATLAEYPFRFELYAEYELSGDTLCASFKVCNRDEKIMPYMFGWHPGFTLFTDGGADINDYYVDFLGLESLAMHPLQLGPFANPVAEEYKLTDGKIRINEGYLYPRDTMVMLSHENKCVLGTEKNSYRVFLEWSKNLPVLAIWKDDHNDAKFLCLEPWTWMPADGINEENFETRKMERLAPMQEEIYSYKLKIEF